MKKIIYIKILILLFVSCKEKREMFTQKWEIETVTMEYSEEKLKLKTEEVIEQEEEMIKDLIGFLHFKKGGAFNTKLPEYKGKWILNEGEFSLKKQGSDEADIYLIETLSSSRLTFIDNNTEGVTLTYSLVPFKPHQ